MDQEQSLSIKLLVIFLCVFIILVGILPAIIYSSILPDSAQNIAWGHAWSWGYTQHPPLGVWFLNVMILIFKNNELATYLASAICLAVSLLYIYRISKIFLTIKTAVAATMLSSLSYFYMANFALQYNQNTIMLPFWVMSAFYFWLAMKEPNLKNWVLLAIVSVLSILAKYESFIILFLEFLYLIFNYKREYSKYLLFAIAIFITLLIPHIIWLFDTDFLTIGYLFQRSNSQYQSILGSHIYNPLSCFFGQPLSLLIALIVLLVLNRLKLIRFLGYRKLNSYLVYLGWAPLVLVTFISAVGGINIAGEWGFVLFSFTISGLFVWLKADTTALNIVKLTITVIIIRVLVIIIFGIVNFKDNKVHHINYPGYAIAKVADSYWLEHKGKKPIKYAGGKDPLGYYLAAYLPSKPMFISGLSIAKSPWVKIKLLKEYGAIFIFDGCHKKLNRHLVDSNIKLINPACYSIDAANKSHKVKIEFTLAMVPPSTKP